MGEAVSHSYLYRNKNMLRYQMLVMESTYIKNINTHGYSFDKYMDCKVNNY